ncbi:MAG: DUF4339 domain-containing protein [Chthoniobacteraceae bacterium]
MSFREAYYLHVHGEQLGPYTLRQLDHQLQTGLISEDTLYWSENLDQWQPVTQLIPLRKKFRPLRAAIIALVLLVPLGAMAWFFGPTALDGWREQTQRQYSPEAAYWAARGVVRHELAVANMAPQFLPFSAARVEMGAENTAVVHVEGRALTGAASGQPAAWKVRLRFDPAVRTWSPLPVQPASP